MFFDGIEIPVRMQQTMAILDAKRGNRHINGFPNRHPSPAQFPIIPRALESDIPAQHRAEFQKALDSESYDEYQGKRQEELKK